MPKLKENKYYKLKNGHILKLTYDQGAPTTLGDKTYGGIVYGETIQGERVELRRKLLLEAELLTNYRPTIPEIWKVTCTIKDEEFKDKEFKKEFKEEMKWAKRLQYLFKKLIEFNHIKINTLGYYYKNSAQNKQTIGDSIAYKLSERFFFAFGGKNKHYKTIQAALKDWAETPTAANRAIAFQTSNMHKGLEVDVDRECHITGERFQWLCNGKTVVPIQRTLSRKESNKVRDEYLEELKSLRKCKTPTDAQINRTIYLADVLEAELGWLRAYDLLHRAPAIPFKKAYADPKTGLFPKAVVEIDVPTGKILFANSLFEYLKDFPKNDEYATENSVGNSRGRNNHIFFQAEVNQAFYVPLSNCSPHIWQNRKNQDSIRVGRASEEPRKGEWSYQSAVKGWIDRGYICTDLWAFHACDRSRLPKKIECDHFVVKVTPGRYQLINHYEHDDCANGIYCEIKRVPAKLLN